MKLLHLPIAICLLVFACGCPPIKAAKKKPTAPPPGGAASGTTTSSPAAPATNVDLTTPEAAVLSLEEAYRNADMTAALRCKDFKKQAQLMFENLGNEFALNAEMIAFQRDQLKEEFVQQGAPDYLGVTSTFSDKQPYNGHDDVVQMKETCTRAGGTKAEFNVLCAKTDEGWKVIVVQPVAP